MTEPADAPPRPRVTVLVGDVAAPDPTKPLDRYAKEDLAAIETLKAALGELPEYAFEVIDRHDGLLARWLAEPPEFVLNFCDTGFRNRPTQEAAVAGFLDMLGVPYSGATPFAIVACYDKQLVRLAAAASGVPVPGEVYVAPGAPPDLDRLSYPAFVKPNQADGSLGITRDAIVDGPEAARRTLAWLWRELPGRAALIQELLPGREVSVGLVGNPPDSLAALPLLEVDYSGLDPSLPRLLGYESKSFPDSPYWTDIRFRPAEIDAAEAARLIETSKRLFARFGLRDYGRFDFRTDANGVIKLLEVNPNPAWAFDGKLAMMAGFAGRSYAEYLGMLLAAARARCAAERGRDSEGRGRAQ